MKVGYLGTGDTWIKQDDKLLVTLLTILLSEVIIKCYHSLFQGFGEFFPRKKVEKDGNLQRPRCEPISPNHPEILEKLPFCPRNSEGICIFIVLF